MVAFFLLSLYGRVIAYLPSRCSSPLCRLLAKVALLTSLRARVVRGIGQFSWTGDYDVEDLAQNHIRFLVDMFHKLLYVRYHPWPRRRVANQVRYENEGYLKEALMGKKGVILLPIHRGNFFWSFGGLSLIYPFNLLVHQKRTLAGRPSPQRLGRSSRSKPSIAREPE